MTNLPKPHIDHGKFFKMIEPSLPEGDVIEFGVFQGGSTRQLAQLGRRVWALDTFEGMPAEDFREDQGDHDLPGKFKSKFTVWEMFKNNPNICPLQGRFVDTLPIIPKSIQIAFAYMDCDLYESYMQALSWLEKHLVKDAYVFIDDYKACAGCRKAVDLWSKDKSIELKTLGDLWSEGKPIEWKNLGDRRYFKWIEK